MGIPLIGMGLWCRLSTRRVVILLCPVLLLSVVVCTWVSRNAFFDSNLYRNIEPRALKGIRYCVSEGVPVEATSRDCNLPSVNGVTIVTFASSGWTDLLNNWLCSLRKVGLEKAVYIVAFGSDACSSLAPTGIACKNAEQTPSAANYGQEGYQKMLEIRTREILRLLGCGTTILVTDADVVFLKDPLPTLRALSEGKDMLFQGDSVDHQVADSVIPYVANYACLGFMYLKPSPGTTALWEGVHNFQKNFYWNDQAAVNVCLRHPTFLMTVKWSVLDYWQFPNGIQFFKRKVPVKDAFIVHTNFVLGGLSKVAEMMAAGVWCYEPAIANTCRQAYSVGCVNSKPAKTWCNGLELYCREHQVQL